MKKILKKILGFIALVLIVGGLVVLGWQYFRNKQLLEVLLNNSIVQGSIEVLFKMLYSVLAIFLGLIVWIFYLKIGGSIRKDEKQKAKEINEQLKAKDEALKAKEEELRQQKEIQLENQDNREFEQ